MARWRNRLGRVVPALLVAAALVGLAPGLDATPGAKAAASIRNTGLLISPVFSKTLVGGFDQAGNTLLQCSARTDGSALPPITTALPDGCVRDINTGLSLVSSNPQNLPFYNNETIQKFLDRDTNSTTTRSSSATVTVPAGATAVYAELEWLGTSQASPNPNIVWNPNIWQMPMRMSVGDDQHYASISPNQGTSIMPGSPASDTNDYYYSASANVTQYLAGRTGQITVWGADAAFPTNGFNQAGLGWDIVVVYQYPSVDLTANPPHVAKQITLQTGFVYQQSGAAATNTVVNVPEVTDGTQVQVGLIAGEGDTGLTGDTFSINGHNIPHPVTKQTSNFFVSYAQNATNPNWTSNFSTDNVEWTLASGIVNNGDTSVTLSTTTSGDGYFLAGLTTAIPVPEVCLQKSVDTNPYTTVGQTLTYTFTVTNCSGASIDRVTVSDPLFVASPGTIAACNQSAVLAPAASYTCTATHMVTAADIAAGQILNTATANAFIPNTTTSVAPATASATTVTSTSLSITKTGAPKPVNVGGTFTYTITATNLGPADAANVTVTDPLPDGLANPTVTSGNATITGGVLHATTPLLSHVAPNNTFTITVSGTIASGFTGTSITNTATVQAGGNTNCPSGSTDPVCSATDTTQVLQPAPITITKVTSNSAPKPGATFTYTVQVTNTSTTTNATATVNDPIPANLVNASWTCAPSTGSTCGTTSGTGNITGAALTLEPLGVATFTITVTVDPTFQGGTITNTATATPARPNTFCEVGGPTATNCSASVPVVVTPDPALLAISKSHTPTNPSPGAGQPITYTLTITNTSTSTIAHATLTDPVPAQIVADGGWTTTLTGTGTTATPASATTGFPSAVVLAIAPGGTVTLTIHAHVSATYDGTQVTNIATATPGTNTGCQDMQPTCVAEDPFTNPAQLEITKTHTPLSPTPAPGQRFTYDVTVTNAGSSATASGTFSDPLPDPPLDAAGATWTCTPTGATSTCGAATGTGSPAGVAITVAPNGGTVVFAISVSIRASAVAVTVKNVSTVSTNPGTTCSDGGTTCNGEDTFEATPQTAQITISKSQSPTTPAQGGAITYSVVVTNTSALTTANATLSDPVPDQIVADGGWTTTLAGTGTTATPASATTGFPSAVVLVIAPGGTVTFTIHAHVAVPYNGTTVTNIATATPGTNTACESGNLTCQAQVSFANPAQLEIDKTHTPLSPTPVPGQRFTYDVTVTNPSSGATGSGTFSDPLPDPPLDGAGATWTCTPTGATSTCGAATGSGSPTGVATTVAPNGGTVVFAITVTIRTSDVPVAVHNVGTVTTNPGTTCSEGGTTCNGEDTFEATPQTAQITISKSQTPTTPAQGGAVTYSVVVTNTGLFTTAHATLSDPVPPMIAADGGWTTASTGTGTTATPASATTGFPSAVVLVIAPGGTVTFTIHAHVAVPYNGTTITNIATATPGTNTACENGNLTCQAQVSFANPAQLAVAKTHAPTNPDPVPGQRFTYDVTVTNPSSGATGSGTFSDPLPDPPLDAAGATWTCTPTGATSTCGAATGSGSPTGVAITVAPNGGTVVFAITVTIRTSDVPVMVKNVSTVTTNPGTTCSEGGTTCNGEDTFEATPQTALITITKSHTPASSTPPAQGEALTYTVVVTNTNVFTTAHATLSDPVPPMIAADGGWTTASTGTGTTATPASATTGFPSAVVLVIAPGGTVTFTIHVHVAMNYDGTEVINTATATPGLNTDCANGSPTCQAEDQFVNPARLVVSKTHSPTSPDPVPGQRITYTVTITNPGNSAVGSGTFSDPLPDPPLDAAGATWMCTATGATSTCGAATGTGSPAGVAITVAPNGGTVVFAIDVTIRASEVPVTVHNVGTVTTNPGTACSEGGTTCNAEDTVEATPQTAVITVTKSQTPDTPAEGDLVTYTVVVTNTSAFTTAHATLSDPVPAQIVADGGWTTASTGTGTTATPASATTGFPTSVVLVIAPGGTVTFSVTAHVAVPYNGTEVTNTATATPGLNTACANGNQTCQAQVSFANPATLDVTKTHSPTSPDPVPGQRFTYTVTVTNPSTGATGSGTFSDSLPDPPLDAAGATWTCTPTGATSTCGAPTGTGSPTGVAITVAANGGTVIFTIDVTILASEIPVTVHNAGTVTTNPGTTCSQGGTTCNGEDTFEATPEMAPLTITKSQTPDTPGEGDLITYTVVVTNTSAFTTAHATLSDPVPAQIVADGGWTTATTGAGTTATPASATTGFPSAVVLVIAPGGTVTFTVTVHVAVPYNGTTVTNIATATPGLNTICEDGNQTCQAQVSFANPATLDVTKTHSPTSPDPVPGQRFTYTVTITNPSTGATGSGSFSDPLPDPPLDAAGATWTCTPTGATSTCGAATGTGSPTGVAITVAPNGGTVVFSIDVTILASEIPVTIHNVGTVTTNPGTTCSEGGTTCNGEETFEATPELAPLTITKSQAPDTPDIPGQGDLITYTVVVTNTSAFTTAHATLTDPVPAQIVADGGWTTATTSVGTTATPASATTGFPSAVVLVIAPGGTVTFTVTAHVAVPYNGTEVTNVATATPGLNTICEDGNQTCQAQVSFVNPAQLDVTKTHAPSNPDPLAGQQVTYTVTITNPSTGATGSGTFSDPLPRQLDAATATWTCTPTGPTSTCGAATGTGPPAGVAIAVAPNGGKVTFTIVATIVPSGEPVTIHNIGTVTTKPGTTCTDGSTTCDGQDTVNADQTPATLMIVKTHTPTAPTQGQSFSYTVTVTNTSGTTVAHGTVSDPFDSPALTGVAWTATASAGGSVTADSGSGPIDGVGVTLSPGGTVTFTVEATVRADWPGGEVENTSFVLPGDHTVCDPNSDASCSAPSDFGTPSLISIVKTHVPFATPPQPGQNVIYRVVVTNLSDQQGAKATFADPLPPQLDRAAAVWVTHTTGAGTERDPAFWHRTAHCSGPDLRRGGSDHLHRHGPDRRQLPGRHRHQHRHGHARRQHPL